MKICKILTKIKLWIIKKVNAPLNTVTRDLDVLDRETGNIYQTVRIIAKRANKISIDMKQELNRKLEEFAYFTDNLEEVFENREQIEISKFYERLPKPTQIAIQEFLDGKLHYEFKKSKFLKVRLKGKHINYSVLPEVFAAYKAANSYPFAC
jgi:DNA-directed RNA polymerase subunit K/omega